MDQEVMASVFSLTLHRLQKAPRAIHRAFLSRGSLFRLRRNIEGTYFAQGLSFIRDELLAETCAIQMITRAQKEILIVGLPTDSLIHAALRSVKKEAQTIRIVKLESQHGERLLVVDRKSALVGSGRLQICIEGDLARGLAQTFDTERVTPRESLDAGFSWPFHARVDLESIEVGLSRTRPVSQSSSAIEIERLTLNAIKSARRFIYIETKWLTSKVIVKALSRRLEEMTGPEVIIVVPPETKSSFRTRVLRALQRRAVTALEMSDTFNRFRCFERPLSKMGRPSTEPCHVLIVDDQFLKLGTSTLTAKSFGASYEFDLSFEAVGRTNVVMTIARLRRELIGDLLDVEPSEFDARFLLNGRLVETIESFFHGERELSELSLETSLRQSSWLALGALVDPKRPHSVRRWIGKKLARLSNPARIAVILFMMFALLIMFVSVFAPRPL